MDENLFFNGWLFLDKPEGLSSNKVLQTIRNFMVIQKEGLLVPDPLASGFLPIAIGKATKAIKYLETVRKNTNSELIGVKRPHR